MRIAVVGGTGLAGNEVVRALQARGDEPVVIARSRGVDLVSGEGLDEALAGVEAVVDASNALGSDARAFFEAATTNLLAAERRAGVRHHVVLSIVGVDRVPDNAHYAGKIRQEELALAGPIPVTIVRATQFHDFGAQVAGWTRDGDTATIPPLLVQPIAVSDLGEILAETAAGPGEGAVIEVAGPGTQDLVDMTRRTLAERGEDLRLVAKWGGAFSVAMAGEAMLPGPDARIARTSFEDWLSGSRAAPA